MEDQFNSLKNKLNTFLVRLLLVELGLFIIALILLLVVQNTGFRIAVGCIFIPFSILAIIIYCVKRSNLNTQFKNDIVLKMIKEYDEFATFEIKGGLSENEVYESKVLTKNSGNSFVATDLLTAKVGDISFKSCDLYVYYVVSTGKSTTTVEVFRGRFFAIELDTASTSHIVLREEGNLLGKKPKDMQKIDVESINFNKKFNIYSDNDLEVFKTFKPQQFEYITSLEQKYDGKIGLAIKNGKIYFGLYDSSNNFEISKYETKDSLKQRVDKEFAIVKDLIKCFK